MEYIKTTTGGARKLAAVIYETNTAAANLLVDAAEKIAKSDAPDAHMYVGINEGLRVRVGKES
jgi:hypothetical protein